MNKAEHLRRIADILRGQWERMEAANRAMEGTIAQDDVEAAEIAWRRAEIDVIDSTNPKGD